MTAKLNDPHRGRCQCLEEPPRPLDEMNNLELSRWFGVPIHEPEPEPRETVEERLIRFGVLPPKPARADVTPLRGDQVAKPGHNPRYVAKVISPELERLANTREGSRNHTLNKVAFNIFGLVKAGHVDAGIHAELERIATAIGMPDHEIRSTLRSAWGAAQPRRVPAPGGVAAAYTIGSQTP